MKISYDIAAHHGELGHNVRIGVSRDGEEVIAFLLTPDMAHDMACKLASKARYQRGDFFTDVEYVRPAKPIKEHAKRIGDTDLVREALDKASRGEMATWERHSD